MICLKKTELKFSDFNLMSFLAILRDGGLLFYFYHQNKFKFKFKSQVQSELHRTAPNPYTSGPGLARSELRKNCKRNKTIKYTK